MENKLLPAFAWPGGYTLVYLKGGDVLCNVCASEEPAEDISTHSHDEGEPLYCDECNKEMESSYGIPDED